MIKIPDNISDKDYIDSKELSDILGIRVNSIYRWNMLDTCPLKTVRIGRKIYYSVNSLNRIFNQT